MPDNIKTKSLLKTNNKMRVSLGSMWTVSIYNKFKRKIYLKTNTKLPKKEDKGNFDNQWTIFTEKYSEKQIIKRKKCAKRLLNCWNISWHDVWCEIQFEERIWLVEKISKLGNTLQNPGESWNFKPDKLNKRKLTKGIFFTFSHHIFSTSYYLEILKNPYRSNLCTFRVSGIFAPLATFS